MGQGLGQMGQMGQMGQDKESEWGKGWAKWAKWARRTELEQASEKYAATNVLAVVDGLPGRQGGNH